MSVLVKETTNVKVDSKYHNQIISQGGSNIPDPDAGATLIRNWGNKAGVKKAKGELAGKFKIVGAKEEMKKLRMIRDPNAPK